MSNSTVDDWTETFAPKIRGTWNLHRLLPPSLDFFVLASSLVGVMGNASQAAYAATSSFQDAFANYRLARGLPAVTIDLGMVTGIGYIAKHGSVEASLLGAGFEPILEDECMAIFEAAIAQPFRPVGRGNIVTGLGLGRYSGGDFLKPMFQHPEFSHARQYARLAAGQETGGPGGAGSATARRVGEVLRTAKSLAEAQEHILDAVRRKLASLLAVQVDDIHTTRTMNSYGLDSLIAVVSSPLPLYPTSSGC